VGIAVWGEMGLEVRMGRGWRVMGRNMGGAVKVGYIDWLREDK